MRRSQRLRGAASRSSSWCTSPTPPGGPWIPIRRVLRCGRRDRVFEPFEQAMHFVERTGFADTHCTASSTRSYCSGTARTPCRPRPAAFSMGVSDDVGDVAQQPGRYRSRLQLRFDGRSIGEKKVMNGVVGCTHRGSRLNPARSEPIESQRPRNEVRLFFAAKPRHVVLGFDHCCSRNTTGML